MFFLLTLLMIETENLTIKSENSNTIQISIQISNTNILYCHKFRADFY